MEKRDTRLFQQKTVSTQHDQSWNIVELESRRHLRQKIDELISLTTLRTLSTQELEALMTTSINKYGSRFTTLLVRSLCVHDQEKRQAIVDLLTLLHDPDTIPALEEMARAEELPRSIRLSASLALAGMNATRETKKPQRSIRALHYKLS